MKRAITLAFVVMAATSWSCSSPSAGGAGGPDDFTSTALFKDAVGASGFGYHLGSSPPAIAGKYTSQATVIKSADPSTVGATSCAGSYCYYNETGSHVDSREACDASSGESIGGGLLETGADGKISIWKDAHITDDSGCKTRTFVVSALDRLGDGTLQGQVLVVVVEDDGCTGRPVGFWQLKNATFKPAGACTGP